MIPGQNGGQPWLIGNGAANITINNIQVLGLEPPQIPSGNTTITVTSAQLANLTLHIVTGSGTNIVDATAFQGTANFKGGSGPVTFKIGTQLPQGNTYKGGAGFSELDVIGTGIDSFIIQGGMLLLGTNKASTTITNVCKVVLIGGADSQLNTFITDGTVPYIVLVGGSGKNVFNVAATGNISILTPTSATNDLTVTSYDATQNIIVSQTTATGRIIFSGSINWSVADISTLSLVGSFAGNSIDASKLMIPVTIHTRNGNNRVFLPYDASATLNGDAGADTVWLGDGPDMFFDDINLAGTSGTDQIEGPSGHNGTGINHIITGSGNDLIYSGSGNDIINSGDGNDSIYAGSGTGAVDDVTFGNGNTTLTGSNASITVHGGTGTDTVDLGATTAPDKVFLGNGNNFVQTGSGDDYVITGSGNDVIHTGAGNDEIHAGDGNDTVTGGAGNDTVDGGSGENRLFGSENDGTHVSTGSDIIEGSMVEGVLLVGDLFLSYTQRYALLLRSDGDVVTRYFPNPADRSQFIDEGFDSQTSGSPGNALVMQGDGNLILEGPANGNPNQDLFDSVHNLKFGLDPTNTLSWDDSPANDPSPGYLAIRDHNPLIGNWWELTKITVPG